MVKTTERSSGTPYYIEKVDGEEKYQVMDSETGDVKSEWPTRREAAKEMKVLLNPEEMEKRRKAAESEEDDEDDEY